MLGGWLTWMWGWRAVFGFLSAAGVVMLLVYARNLPETLPPARRQAIRLDKLLRNYRFVLGSPWFMRLTVAHSCNWAAMFLYVAAAPQFLTQLLGGPHRRLPGLHPHDGRADGWLSMSAALAATLGHATHPVPCLCRICLRQPAQYHAGRKGSPSLIHLLPVAAFAFVTALFMPLLVGHALHPFPDNAGLAASCQMFLQYSMMAVVAGLLAPLLWDSLSHLALGCAALTCISMTLLLWQRYAKHKAQRQPHEV